MKNEANLNCFYLAEAFSPLTSVPHKNKTGEELLSFYRNYPRKGTTLLATRSFGTIRTAHGQTGSLCSVLGIFP